MYYYKSILEYCAENPEKVMGVVDKARKKTIKMGQNAEGQIPVQMKYVPEDYKVSYLISEKLGIPVEGGVPTAITLWAPLSDDEHEILVDYWGAHRLTDDFSGPDLADGSMHYLALTTNTSGSELWSIENGKASSLGNASNMVPGGDWTNSVINLGNGGAIAEWPEGFWEGSIGFVGVWNRVLSPSELGNAPYLDAKTQNQPTLQDFGISNMLVKMTFDDQSDLHGNTLELFGDAEISGGNLILDGDGDYAQISGEFAKTINVGQELTIVLSIATELDQDYKTAAPFGMGIPEATPEDEPRIERKVSKVTNADLLKKPVATRTRPRPYAYILPRDAKKAVNLLKMHNITVEVLQKDISIVVEGYLLKDIQRKKVHNHPEAAIVTVEDSTVFKEMNFPEGTFIVRTGQVMGRIISHMLEPETPENIIIWNTMDNLLPQPGPDSIVPIYKVHKPINLPIALIDD